MGRVYQRDHEHLVTQVIEDDQSIGDGEVRLGDFQVIGRRLRQPFQISHRVIGEIPDGSTHEGGQVRQRGDAFLTQDLRQPPERVFGWHFTHPVSVHDGVDPVPVRERPFGIEAKKRITSEAFGGLGALQEEHVLLVGELEHG